MSNRAFRTGVPNLWSSRRSVSALSCPNPVQVMRQTPAPSSVAVDPVLRRRRALEAAQAAEAERQKAEKAEADRRQAERDARRGEIEAKEREVQERKDRIAAEEAEKAPHQQHQPHQLPPIQTQPPCRHAKTMALPVAKRQRPSARIAKRTTASKTRTATRAVVMIVAVLAN